MRSWVAAVALASAAAAGCTYTPPRAALAPPSLAESTRIFDADGRLITQLEAEENRENVRLSELPRHLLDAVVAIEDDRYWEHKGVDVKAVLRAAVTNTQEGEVVEGGSTITQQYVKIALLDDEKTINRKVKEALLAVQLERSSTKERILELYLNTIYFGNGAYGVQAAAQEYFGVAAADVDVAQSALLAGLIQAPKRHDPYDRPDDALARRDVVLERMGELDLLSEDAVAHARTQPLLVRLRPAEERYPAAHFVEQVKRFVLDDERFGATPAVRRLLLFGGGLRIHTTLDLDQQAMAETAIASVRPEPDGPDTALVALEPSTGFVRSLVGGRDFFSGGARAKLDLVTGGPGRPAGSAFKPLVLAAALEDGITLDRVYRAPSRLTIPLETGDWEVENYEGTAGGSATLLEATVRSYNTVYAQVIMDVGPEKAMDMARRLGVRSTLRPYPSAVLGTNDVHPLDMAAAYATLANRGLRIDPVFVTRITNADGTVLYQHRHEQRRVIEARVADEVTSVLQQAVERGTGTRARLGERPVAGKTGTGQEWRDAWFVGFTPDLVSAVWMGFAEEGRRSMKPPATPLRVTGGSWPATIWQHFAHAALDGVPVTPFPAVEPRPAPPGERRVGEVAATTTTVVARRDVEVPNTLGLSEQNARSALGGAELEVVVVHEDGGEPGIVWQQSPPPGSVVPAGTTVRIWVTPEPDGPSTTTTAPG